MALSRSTKRRIIRGAATVAIMGGALGLGGMGFKAFKTHQAKTRVAAIQTLSKAGVRNPEQWFGFKKEGVLQLNPRRPKDQQIIVIIDNISKSTKIPAEKVAETISHVKYLRPPYGNGIEPYVGEIKDRINSYNRKLAGTKEKWQKAEIEKELRRLREIRSICEELQKLPKEYQPLVDNYSLRAANSREQ